MGAIVDTAEEAAALARPPLLVRRPLEAFLDAHGLGAGPLAAAPIGDGHSNVTYRIERAQGGPWVLRRPPRPPLPPSAHDVLREARVLQAVAGRARVPRVLAACADVRVLGVPFYVMEHVDGDVLAPPLPPRLHGAATAARIGDELVDALAEIHAVDWRAVGLEGYGRPSGYLERQLRRFGGLWEHNRTRQVPAMERVAAWLAAHRPTSGPATIVHGDFRPGNAMVGSGAPPRVVAVLDWELATIGDPLADVGYLVATWSEAGDPETPFARLAVTRAPGFHSRAELVARYEERTGRSVPDLRWYATLALWKAAVFLEGSYKRRLAGTADDPFFDELEAGVPALAEQAWAMTSAPAAR